MREGKRNSEQKQALPHRKSSNFQIRKKAQDTFRQILVTYPHHADHALAMRASLRQNKRK